MRRNEMIKRNNPKFRVPNYGAPNRKGVKARWRHQRGIDNKRRVKKQNRGSVPKVGYKNSDIVRYSRPDGSFELLVHNEAELLSVLGMPGYSARFAHNLSSRKRESLKKIADSNRIKILNA